jgi:hypothetical protein
VPVTAGGRQPAQEEFGRAGAKNEVGLHSWAVRISRMLPLHKPSVSNGFGRSMDIAMSKLFKESQPSGPLTSSEWSNQKLCLKMYLVMAIRWSSYAPSIHCGTVMIRKQYHTLVQTNRANCSIGLFITLLFGSCTFFKTRRRRRRQPIAFGMVHDAREHTGKSGAIPCRLLSCPTLAKSGSVPWRPPWLAYAVVRRSLRWLSQWWRCSYCHGHCKTAL